MKDKIKLMSIGNRKAKAEDSKSWAETVEHFAPDMYELFYGVAGKDAYKKVSELQPEIILLLTVVEDSDIQKGLQMVREMRQLSPQTMIFVVFDVLDDEEAVFDEYIACGAYKCYASPVIMNAVFHDMYVALNLE